MKIADRLRYRVANPHMRGTVEDCQNAADALDAAEKALEWLAEDDSLDAQRHAKQILAKLRGEA
ncbi:MAG: hypothetical protein INF12_14805 [Methylobacterium sp.]|nr:hypothetical protein [Methylobacterium sp.]